MQMKKLSIILLLLGITIAAIPVLGQAYTRYLENRLMDEWLNSVDADGMDSDYELNAEEAYAQLQDAFLSETRSREANASLSEGSDGTGGATEPVRSDGENTASVESAAGSGSVADTPSQKVLGIIQIKKIKVKAPIVEGVKPFNLKTAVGHIPGTAGLGKPGNCALAGHRSYTFGKFFNRLDELEIGDEIVVTTKKEDLKYKVIKIHVVTPDDVSVLEGSKDNNLITLITCTPIYVASHRLIVVGDLDERVMREP